MLPVVCLYKAWRYVVRGISFGKQHSVAFPLAHAALVRPWQSHRAHHSLLAPCRKHQKHIALILLSSYLSMPGVLLAQGITVADNARAPALDTAANGVPIVNINAPSAKGVSRNEYDQLNVESKGLIFNNSTAIVQTKLAGYVDGNKRLGGQSAGIILNEVVGNSRSALNGYMEIAGQRAQLIIANQSGITCNGCGFINTSRGVLTTGSSVFDAFGNLSSFDVSKGDVEITGQGFNDTDTDEVDILARSVSLNAKMWANQVTVITGDNLINYQDKSVTARSTGDKTGFSLDVAAIGGMYANRIRLIGTEKGLGVNLEGEIKAAADMTLDSQGNLVNKGHLSGQQVSVSAKNINNTGELLGDNIALAATDLNNTGNRAGIQATESLQIQLQGDLNNQDSAKIQATKTLDLQLQGNLTNQGGATIQTPDGLLTINANSIINQSTMAANQLSIRAAQLNNQTESASIYGIDKVDLTLTGQLNNTDSALIQSDNQFVINANGDITNSSATLASIGSITLNSQNLSNTGKIQAQNGLLTIKETQLIDNQGRIQGNGIKLTADQLTNSTESGKIYSLGTLDLTVDGTITNKDKALIHADQLLTLTSTNGDLINTDAIIESVTKATLKSNKLTNSGTLLTQDDSLTIHATDIENQGAIQSHGLTITADSLENSTELGELYSTDTLDLTIDGIITNKDSALIHADNTLVLTSTHGDFFNSNAKIEAIGVTKVNAQNVTNTGTLIVQDGRLTIKNGEEGTGKVDNQGTLQGKGLTITADVLENSTANGKIYSADTLDLVVDGTVINKDSGLIHGDQTVNITSTHGDLINANATIESATNTNIKSQNLTNSGTILAQGDTLTIRAQQIDNERLLGGKNIDINASVLNNNTSTSQIYADNDVDVTTTAGAITNSNGALIHGGNNLTLTAAGDLINSNATIESATNATLNSHNLSNSANSTLLAQNGTLIIHTGNLSNDGTITGKNITATASVVNNNKATSDMAATNDLTLKTTQGNVNNTNGAHIRANNSLTIDAAADLINTGSSIESASNMALSSRHLTNSGNALIRANDSFVVNWTGNLLNTGSKIEAKNNISTTRNSGNLTNTSSGLITALNGTLGLTLANLNNQGSMGANRIELNTSGVTNTGSSALILANSHLDVRSTSNMDNLDGGSLFSLGSGYLQANGTITNSSATIETGGDLEIHAHRLINTITDIDKVKINYKSVAVGSGREEYGELNDPYRSYKKQQNGIVIEYDITDSHPSIDPSKVKAQGEILSAGNLDLYGNTDNLYSIISATQNLNAHGYHVNNISYEQDIISKKEGTKTTYIGQRGGCTGYSNGSDSEHSNSGDGGHCDRWSYYFATTVEAYSSPSTSRPVTLINSTFSGGKAITGKGGSLNNVGTSATVTSLAAQEKASETLGSATDIDFSDPTQAPQAFNDAQIKSRRDAIFNQNLVNELVSSALFKASDAPNSPVLVETNPLLTNYKSFISSDYLLNKTTGDATGRTGKTTTRLGDGYLEQKLVRDQILSFTGYQTLPDSLDIESTYAALMNNAVDVYEDLGLSTGVELSAAQIAQLQEPIVWMVTETVDTPNGPQQALVPKVYFSAASGLELRPDGALIAASSIDIETDGDINNTGSMLAKVDLSLKGNNIDNSGTVSSAGRASLSARQDIKNTRTITAAGDLSLVAGGSISNETLSETRKVTLEGYSDSETIVGDTASIQGGNVSLSAGNDILLIGSEVGATGDLALAAGNNVSIEAIAINKSQSVDYGNNSESSASTTYQVSSLSGANIQLSAANTLTSEGAQIKAQGNLALAANNIDLLAVQNTTQSKRDEWGSKQSSASTTNQVSALSGANIQLSATNTLTSEGAQIKAQGNLALAANNIDLLAVTDSKDKYSFVGGGGNSTEQRSHKETVTGTTLNASGSLSLVSQQDIFSEGSALRGGTGISLAAGGDVILASAVANNSSFKEVKTKKSGFFGSKSSTTTTTSQSLTNQGTHLSSGGDLTIASGVDVLLAGSKASAEGDISVQAGGDIQLLSVVDQSSQRYQQQKKGTFKVKANDQGFIKQTAVTSDLIGGGNIHLDSGSNITLEGATLAANDTLTIGTDVVTQNANGQYVNDKGELAGNVTVTTQALESSEWSESSSGFRGVFKDLAKGLAVVASVGTAGLVHGEIKVGESDATRTDTLTQQTTTLAAADLDLTAQQDLTLIGAQVAVSDTANLTAQNVTLDAAQERTVTSTSHTDQTVSGEGASFSSEKGELTLSSVTETDHTERTITTANTWAGSSLQAGNLNIKANQNVAIIASDVSVQNDASIEGENVLIGGRQDTTDTTNDSITKTKTLTVGVKNAYADTYLAVRALDQAKDAVKDAEKAYDDAKQKVADGKLPKNDLDFYKANLAVATANVASATTAVYASGAAAVAAASTSGGTGFYVSGGATTQTDTTSTTSSQGTWNGSNINVGNNTNLTSDNNLNIEGSNINTAGQLALDASNINISAGKNTYTENTESHSEGGGISVSMQPTTTSYSGSINASQSRSDYQATDYVNSQIGAGSLVSNSDDLTIQGGNVSADDVDITTGRLTVESLQNTSSGSSTSAGFSVSASLGGSDEGWEDNNEDPSKSPAAAGVTGFGVNASKGNSEQAWVAQQSGITGGQVNITAKDTSLTGAVIAAVDEQGQTTDKLTLTTGTLTVTDIQDTDTSQNIGLGYSVSGLATGETPTDNTDPDAKDPMDPSQSTYSASFNGHDKQQNTKATIGLGNVTVGGSNIDEQAQFADLNRDITNSQEITKDVERGGLDANLTVDNRMLSEAGRDEIAEDILKTDMLVDSAILVATTERVGLLDFGEEVAKTHTVYETVKAELAGDEILAGKLQDPSLSAQEKESMLNELTHTVMQSLGYETEGYDNKIIADETATGVYEDGSGGKVAGFHSNETRDSYINDVNIDSTALLVNAAGHESSHEMDAQDGVSYSLSDNEAYANNFGSNLASYTNLALDINGYDDGMATTNSHVGNNSDYVKTNTAEYTGLDKAQGDFLTIFVHGTYSSPSDADPDFISVVGKTFDEPVIQFDWSGESGAEGLSDDDIADNTDTARMNAGERLADYIENYDFAEEEKLNLVGHSHGGNVIKVSTQSYEGDKTIDSVYFLATPHRSSYKIDSNKLSSDATLINVYDKSDLVQLGGQFGDEDIFNSFGGIMDIDIGPSNDLRSFNHVPVEVKNDIKIKSNMDVVKYPINYLKAEFLDDHSNMDSKEVWLEVSR